MTVYTQHDKFPSPNYFPGCCSMFLYGEGAGCDHTHIHNITYRIKRRELCVEFCFYLLPFYFSSPFFFMDFSLCGENISSTPRNKSVNLGDFLHFHEIESMSSMIRFSTRKSNMPKHFSLELAIGHSKCDVTGSKNHVSKRSH